MNKIEFIKFIEEETKQENFNDKARKDFLNKVPFQYHNFVINAIDKKHNGDLENYKKTIPLFEKKFTRELKAYAEKSIVSDKNNNRSLSKKKKQAILYCGQLLKCVGGKNMTAIAPFAVINEYEYQQEQQELFCKRNKLMNAMGQLVKLTSPKQRKIERNSQSYRQAKAMEEQAKSLGYTFAFITLTLPPNFHPNPTVSKNNAYNGATPQEAVDTLNHFWKLIRSNLADKGLKVGVDFFGVRVVEGHKDSCLHGHNLLHIHPNNMKALQEVVMTVEKNERIRLSKLYNIELKKFKMKWDFKAEWKTSNKKRAKASSYLFKYLSPDVNNKETIANEALRSAYGSRAIQWFGLKNKITTFNHLIKNWKPYENQIENIEVVEMLKTKDLNLFYNKYEKDFINVSIKVDGKNKFLGVSYVPNRNTGISQKEILITKKQFILVENEDKSIIEKFGQSMIGLEIEKDVDLFNSNVSNALASFPKAQKRQVEFNELVLNYYQNQSVKGFNNFVPALGCYYADTCEKVIKQYMNEELEEFKNKFELNFENDYFKTFNGIKKESELDLDINTEYLLLTLKHHYSSKNPSGFCKSAENTKIPIDNDEILEVFN